MFRPIEVYLFCNQTKISYSSSMTYGHTFFAKQRSTRQSRWPLLISFLIILSTRYALHFFGNYHTTQKGFPFSKTKFVANNGS